MPTAAQILRRNRLRRRVQRRVARGQSVLERARALEGAEQKAQQEIDERPSILQRISNFFEAVDAPTRGAVASALSGIPFKKDLSPAEFNKAVFGAEPTPEGKIPFKELATSVVVSPFNLVSGIGVLSKSGRAAQQAGKLSARLKAVKDAERLTNVGVKATEKALGKALPIKLQTNVTQAAKKLAKIEKELAAAGKPLRLAETIGGQIRTGQRGLINLAIPFTQSARLGGLAVGRGIPGAATAGDIAGRAGGALLDTGPARFLDKLFRRTPRFTKAQRQQLKALGLTSDDVLETIDAVKTGRAAIEANETILDAALRSELDRMKVRIGRDVTPEEFATIRERLGHAGDLQDRIADLGVSGPTRKLAKLVTELDHEKAILRRVPANQLEAAKMLDDVNAEVTKAQQLAFGRGARSLTREDKVGFIKRQLTPEARDILAKSGGAATQDAINNAIGDAFGAVGRTFDPSQIGRNIVARNRFTAELNNRLKAIVPGLKGVDFFDLDPVGPLARMISGKSISGLSAEVAQNFAKRFTSTGVEAGIPLSQFLARVGVFGLNEDTVRVLMMKSGVPPNSARILSFPSRPFEGARPELARGAIQETLEKAGIGNLHIPRELADLFESTVRPFVDTSPAGGLLGFFDQINRVFADRLTNPFPAFHAVNATGNMFAMAMGGYNPLTTARLLGAARKMMRDPKQLQFFKALGLIQRRAGQAGAIVSDLDAARGLGMVGKGKAAIKTLGDAITFGPKTRGALGKALRLPEEGIGSGIENTFRVAMYLGGKRLKGLTDIDAVREVNKHLFDYFSLTNFEQKFMNRVIFFYRWKRNAIPWLVENMFQNPAVFRLMSRVSTGDQSIAPVSPGSPSFTRQLGTIPFGRTAEGDPQVGQIRTPIEEFTTLDIGGPKLPPGKGPLPFLQSAAQKFFETSTPLLRTGAEALSQRDLFFDRPIIQQDRAPPILREGGAIDSVIPLGAIRSLFGFEEKKGPRGQRRFRMDPFVAWFIRQTPVSRWFSTGFKIDDPRRDAFLAGASKAALAQLIFGVRVFSFDEQRGVLRNARRVFQRTMEDLERSGSVRSGQHFYFDKGANEEDPKVIERKKIFEAARAATAEISKALQGDDAQIQAAQRRRDQGGVQPSEPFQQFDALQSQGAGL